MGDSYNYVFDTTGGVWVPEASSAGGIPVVSIEELPAAAALNGTWAKTTSTTIIGSPVMANDGTNVILVSSGAGTVATALRTTLGSDDPAVVSLQLIDDAIFTDDAAYTPATSKGIVVMAQADETGPDSVDEGDAGALRMTLTRFLKISLGDLLSGEDQTNNVFACVEKPLAVSTYCPDLDTSAAAEASSVTKASAGVLYGVTFSNANAATRYFQVFNSTTVPADTTVPVIVAACPALSTITLEWPKGRFFSTGIAWCGSSTQSTKTIGSTDFLADVNFK